MIRHIVFFSAKDKADLPAILEGLGTLAGIRHHDHFESSRTRRVDPMGNDVDVVVYAEFRNRAALDAYKADPILPASTQRRAPLARHSLFRDYEVSTRLNRRSAETRRVDPPTPAPASGSLVAAAMRSERSRVRRQFALDLDAQFRGSSARRLRRRRSR